MELKDRVAAAMKAKGMSQADLCRAAGITSSKASYILQGKTTDPRLSTAIRIADALGVSLDYLAGREQPPPRPHYSDPRQQRINDAYESMSELMKDATASSVVSMLGAESARSSKQVQDGVEEAM